jgi:hypothetical protein
LTLTIRFHENKNFGKKRHPRNVRGHTRHRETFNGLVDAGFAELPLCPYK